MLLFHSIYTPVSSAGANPVLTPPRDDVFISSLQTPSPTWRRLLLLLHRPARIQTQPSKSRSSLSCQNPIDCVFDQTSFSTEPLTTRNSLTDEDVGGMRESEARNAAEKKGEAGRGGRKHCELKTKAPFFFVLSELHRVLVLGEHENSAEDCFFFYPADGESLLSLPSGFGWMISETPPLAQQLTASSCCTVWPTVFQGLGNYLLGVLA